MASGANEKQIVNWPDYLPSNRQQLFHDSKAFETLYGGAAGGGKTEALCAEAVTLCLEHPGITVYMFRRTYPELDATIVKSLNRQCAIPIEMGRMKYNAQKHEFTFVEEKSSIQLAYCEHPDDVYRYQSAEFQVLMIDELTHFPRDTYDYLKTRVRSSNPAFPLKVMCATNPGNVGHSWVRERFIDAFPSERVYTDEALARQITDRDASIDPSVAQYMSTRMFIPAKVSDNPSPEFVASYSAGLEGLGDPDLKRALLEGDWDQFEGQVFTEWRRDLHVIDNFDIPYHWPRWFAYDYGYNTWAAGLWFTKDPQSQRVFIYREMYVSKMAASRQAELILQLSGGEDIRVKWADPAIWKQPADAETGETIAQIMMKHRVFFQPANNNRLQGKNSWHEALAMAPDGKPFLQVFRSCQNTIRTIPELPYDKHKIEDVDTDAEDHLYDAGRYGLVNQLRPPIARQRKKRVFDKVTGRMIS